MQPEAFVKAFWRERVSAILRTDSMERGEAAMEAAVRGGFRVIEFTLTTPGGLDLISRFARAAHGTSELVVGAGTVLTREEARAAVGAGARFLVSPVVDEGVIEEAARLGVASIPGAH